MPFSEVVPAAALLSTCVRRGEREVATVEHLFAALAAYSVHEGLRVEVSAAELPLLDGTALPWSAALRALDFQEAKPRFRVAQSFDFVEGASTYTFRVSDQTVVSCVLRTEDPRLTKDASWSGSAADFHARIAGARTFAFARDLDAYARLGAKVHLNPADVIIIGDEIYSSGRPFEADEPVRHKLLDLLGDTFAHGGPLRGELHAIAPGHARTHAAFERAKANGTIVPV